MAAVELKPLPPKEAVRFFRQKGLQESFDWRDVWEAEHARAFTVAKTSGFRGVLEDIRAELDKALAEGSTLERFREELRPKLEARGWWGRKSMVDPQTGEEREVQLGSPRRLRTIYETNLRSAYNAGRWERFQKTKDAFDLRYNHTDGEQFPRPQHEAWDGTVLPADDPWWATHFTPNGFGCKCYITQVRKGTPTRRPEKFLPRAYTNTRTGEVTLLEEGIDPGFNFNPGAAYLAQMTPRPPAPETPPMPRGLPIDPAPARKPRPGPKPLPADVDQAEAEAAFLGGFGLAPGEAAALKDVAGEPMVVGPGMFASAAGRPVTLKPEQLQALPLVGQALRDPDEIRWIWRLGPKGALLMRRYLARIQAGRGKVVEVVVDQAAGGGGPSWAFTTSLEPGFGADPDGFAIGAVAWKRPAG